MKTDEENKHRVDIFQTAINPTKAMLEAVALLYTTGIDERPSVFTGNIPEWTVPAGVIFGQSTIDGSWVMMKDTTATTETNCAGAEEIVSKTTQVWKATDVLDKIFGPPIVAPEDDVVHELTSILDTPPHLLTESDKLDLMENVILAGQYNAKWGTTGEGEANVA